MSLETLARAKVNLALAVTGRRADGYHELASVFLRVGLCDELTARLAGSAAGADALAISGDDTLTVEGNLVLRAASLLRAALAGLTGVSGGFAELPAIAFTLRKRIPVGAGLAGGSSDAAAVLALAAEAWGVAVPAPILATVALRAGADVPFFVAGGAAALVEGIGERLVPLPEVVGRPAFLLMTPDVRLATKDVFAAYDDLPKRPTRAAEAVAGLVSALRGGLDGAGLSALAAQLRDANDLWPAALRVAPQLADVRGAVEGALACPALLTGSGSTLFALYASRDAAVAAGSSLARRSLPALAGARLAAVDDVGPHQAWRLP